MFLMKAFAWNGQCGNAAMVNEPLKGWILAITYITPRSNWSQRCPAVVDRESLFYETLQPSSCKFAGVYVVFCSRRTHLRSFSGIARLAPAPAPHPGQRKKHVIASTACQYACCHNPFLMVYEFCARWGTDQRSQSVIVVKDWLASLKSEHAKLQNCIQHLRFQRFTHSGEGGLGKLQLTHPNDLSLGSGVDMTESYESHHSEKSNLCLLGDLLQSEETGFEDFRLVKL